MFSKRDMDDRRKLVKDRFKIELDNNDLERLEEMTTLAQDKFDHGYAVGTEDDREKWANESIKSAIAIVKRTGLSVDEVLSLVSIPDEHRTYVEKEVRRRLLSES